MVTKTSGQTQNLKPDNTGNFSVVITTASNQTYVLDNTDIIKFYFIEDIYSFSMVGKLIFTDRMGWLETAPFVGNEMITIFYGERTDYEYKFFAAKLEKITPMSSHNPTNRTQLSFLFVDPYYGNFHSKHHSRSYKNTKISDIVYDIMEHHVGTIDYHYLEETNETIDYFYTGLKTPAENIRWLMNRASGTESGQPGYVIFNSTWPEQMTFMTMESILGSQDYIEPQGNGYIYSFADDNMFYINKIIDHSISHVDHNSLKHLGGGILLGYDIQRKKFIKQEYTYRDALDRFTILGNKSLFAENIEYPQLPFKLEAEPSEATIDNLYFGDWIKQYCLQQTVSIVVRGFEERHCGAFIEMEWPSIDENAKINKNMMGKYLVKSVTHQFSPSTNPPYIQKLVLIKNGYYDSDDTTLVKAVKKNITDKGGYVLKG